MSVQLLIRDGNPHWYLSPDIWVVPGSDPAGPPGAPLAGQPAYLWARVTNSGTTDAMGVRIDFYWANPALQVTRSTATFVGSAFADVSAGGTQEALCLVAWTPVVVNNGHECLVAVANHPGDPLPNPLPDAFDPPTYRQVAQLNLTVLVAATAQPMMLSVTVAGLHRIDKAVGVGIEVGGELDPETLARLGLKGWRAAREPVVEAGLAREWRCVGEKDPIGEDRLDVRIPRGTALPVYVAVRARRLVTQEYQLVRIVERDGQRVLGGLGLVVVAEHPNRKARP